MSPGLPLYLHPQQVSLHLPDIFGGFENDFNGKNVALKKKLQKIIITGLKPTSLEHSLGVSLWEAFHAGGT
jgi:hypothetical protein